MTIAQCHNAATEQIVPCLRRVLKGGSAPRATEYLTDPDPMNWNKALERAYDAVARLEEVMDLVKPMSYRRAVALVEKVKPSCSGLSIDSKEKLLAQLNKLDCLVRDSCRAYERHLRPQRKKLSSLRRQRWKTCRPTDKKHAKLSRRLAKQERERGRLSNRLDDAQRSLKKIEDARERRRKEEEAAGEAKKKLTSREKRKRRREERRRKRLVRQRTRYRIRLEKARLALEATRRKLKALEGSLEGCRAQSKEIDGLQKAYHDLRHKLERADTDGLREFVKGLKCAVNQAGLTQAEMLARTRRRRPGTCQSRSSRDVRESSKAFETKAKAFLAKVGMKVESKSRKLVRRLARSVLCKGLEGLVAQLDAKYPDVAGLYGLRAAYLDKLPTLAPEKARRAAIAFQKLRMTINVTKMVALHGIDEEGESRGLRQAHRDHSVVLKRLKKKVSETFTILSSLKRIGASTYISGSAKSHDRCRERWICAKENSSGPCKVGARTEKGCCLPGRSWPVAGEATRKVRIETFCRSGHTYGALDLTTSADEEFTFHFRQKLRLDELPDVLTIMGAKAGASGDSSKPLPAELALEGGAVTTIRRTTSLADSAWKIRSIIKRSSRRRGRFFWAARYLTKASAHALKGKPASLVATLASAVAQGRRFLDRLAAKAIKAHYEKAKKDWEKLQSIAKVDPVLGARVASVMVQAALRLTPAGRALRTLVDKEGSAVAKLVGKLEPRGKSDRTFRRLRRSVKQALADLSAKSVVRGFNHGKPARCPKPASDLGCVDASTRYFEPSRAWKRILDWYLKTDAADAELDGPHAIAIAISLEAALKALKIKNHGNTLIAVVRYSSKEWQVRIKFLMGHLHSVNELLKRGTRFTSSLSIGACGSTGDSPVPHGHLGAKAWIHRKEGDRWVEVPHTLREVSPLVFLAYGPPPPDHKVTCAADQVTTKKQQVSTWASPDGNYYLTTFGCYLDEEGNQHVDREDNCYLSCGNDACAFAEVKIPRYRKSPKTKAACERQKDYFRWDGPNEKSSYACRSKAALSCQNKLKYFVTGRKRRFWPNQPPMACGEKICVHSPATRRTVVAIVGDSGPHCRKVEKKVKHAVLDAGPWVGKALFGRFGLGKFDRKLVRLARVSKSAGKVEHGPITQERARVVCPGLFQ